MSTTNWRRRNNGTCDCCRARRTKCDRSRPKCGTCAQRNIDCIYPKVLSPPKSRVEIELCTIQHRLNSVEKLLSSAQQHRCCLSNQIPNTISIYSWGREQISKADELRSSSVPCMVIQNAGFIDLLGLGSDIARRIANAERAMVPTLHPSSLGVRNFHSSGSSPTSALTAFFKKVHSWYPILSVRLRKKLFNTGSLPTISSERCLYLILVAIGSLAQYDSLPIALRERPDAPLMEEALLLLPPILPESSLTAVQCLISLSIYYLCLVKPCQAHDYILIASMRAQNLLKSASLDTENQELLRRALWVTLLIESEIATQLDLPSSGIWTLDTEIALPSWSQDIDDETLLSPFSTPVDTPGPLFGSLQFQSKLLSYFLAEIAMRRMLQRCTTSTQKLPSGKQVFAPVIAAELELQLEQWHASLPEYLRFDRYCISEPDINPQSLFLRTQYYAYRVSVLWPAVHQVMTEGEQYDITLATYCLELFRYYDCFVLSAVASIPQCLPNTWTLYASVFIITMAVLRAKESPGLSDIVPTELSKSVNAAVHLFDDTVELSPSLHMMQVILAEALAKTSIGIVL